jgi:hypothetical protein
MSPTLCNATGLHKWIIAVVVTVASFAGVAQGSSITMSPGPVTMQGLRGDFTISLQSGDSTTNDLVFSVLGSNPSGSLPAAGIAAIVFDDVSVLTAGEIADADNLITGISISGTGTVAGVLIDFGAPSTASFFVRLSGLPTTATIYSLGSVESGTLSRSSLSTRWISKTEVSFQGSAAPIPEPSAAICFAAGLVAVSIGSRRVL